MNVGIDTAEKIFIKYKQYKVKRFMRGQTTLTGKTVPTDRKFPRGRPVSKIFMVSTGHTDTIL